MKSINRIITGSLAILAMASFASCDKVDYPDRYEVADGKPTVYSVRYADKDVNITQAYMDEVVCLLGKNLKSIVELWFNDQQATLNTSFITDNTLLVSVPKNMPVVQTDKIYMITSGKDTLAYDFAVLPPTPKVISMSNEWASEGETVTIYGDFLIDKADKPLQIAFAGAEVDHASMVFNGSSSVSFPVPAGAQPGYVTVTSLSGTGKSKFMYKDTRNILFDWDGSHGGFATGHGWRNGVIHAPGDDAWNAIDGSYLYFGGADLGPGSADAWAEDQYSFNYWPEAGSDYDALSLRPEFAEFIDKYGVSGLTLKFEVLVPSSNPWSASGMQLMFSSDAVVTYGTATNSYFSDETFPRAIWQPWTTNGGSYDTADKWVTVSFPLSSFNKNQENKECATAFDKSYLTGLTFFVWNGGVDGAACSPVFAIDNIRVVPNE